MPGRRFCRRVTAKGKMCAAGNAIFLSRQNVRCGRVASSSAILVPRQNVRCGQCDFRVTARCTLRAIRFSCHGVSAAAGSAIFLPRQDVRCGRVASGSAILVPRQDVHRGPPQTNRRPVGLCGVPAAERLHSKCLPSQSSSFRHFEPLRGPYYPSRSPYHYENSPKSYKTLVTSQFIAVFMEIKTVFTTKCPEKAINLYKPPNL